MPFRRLLHGPALSHARSVLRGAVAKRPFAEHDQGTQRTLGQIVRRRNTRGIQEHEPLVAMFHDPLLQRDRFVVVG